MKSCAKTVVVEQASEGAPSIEKSITDLSSVTSALSCLDGAHSSRVILLWRDDRGCGHVFGLSMRVLTLAGSDVVR
jgi:hypothetical protein